MAIVATLVPLPAQMVERYYSQGIYPVIQRGVTSASNLAPVAIADIVVALLLAVLAVRFVRAPSDEGWKRAAGHSAITIVTLAAIGQLASFVAWLTCPRGDALAQYSGWLAAYSLSRKAVDPPVRRTLPRLDPGPRRDSLEIAAVYSGSSRVVRAAARSTYDSYLKANRVSEGMASSDAVLKLMLGTPLGADWR